MRINLQIFLLFHRFSIVFRCWFDSRKKEETKLTHFQRYQVIQAKNLTNWKKKIDRTPAHNTNWTTFFLFYIVSVLVWKIHSDERCSIIIMRMNFDISFISTTERWFIWNCCSQQFCEGILFGNMIEDYQSRFWTLIFLWLFHFFIMKIGSSRFPSPFFIYFLSYFDSFLWIFIHSRKGKATRSFIFK